MHFVRIIKGDIEETENYLLVLAVLFGTVQNTKFSECFFSHMLLTQIFITARLSYMTKFETIQ